MSWFLDGVDDAVLSLLHLRGFHNYELGVLDFNVKDEVEVMSYA